MFNIFLFFINYQSTLTIFICHTSSSNFAFFNEYEDNVMAYKCGSFLQSK